MFGAFDEVQVKKMSRILTIWIFIIVRGTYIIDKSTMQLYYFYILAILGNYTGLDESIF